MIVRAVQPIFEKDGKQRRGTRLGDTTNQEGIVKARPGYAVGAMITKTADRMDGFKIVFMRIAGNSLFHLDSYESPWIGGKKGNKDHRLFPKKPGSPVIGVYGKKAGDLDSLGLVFLE